MHRTSAPRRLAYAALWLGFVLYAALLAPRGHPELAGALVRASLRGDFRGFEPWVAAVWNLLGVVPLAFLPLLLRDGAGRRVPAWPFALGMFALGAFALLPYLALRSEARSDGAARSRVADALLRRPAAYYGALGLGALALVGYGALRGDAGAYARWFREANLVHVMSLDLLLCLALLAPVARLARARGPSTR